MGVTKHDAIAQKIAKNKGVEYNKGKGPDVITPTQAIEVATSKNDLNDSTRQLQGYKKARYLAVPKELIKEAIDKVQGTSIGVMGPTGTIIKRAGG